MDQIVQYLQGLSPLLLYPFLSLLVFAVVKILSHFGFLKDGTAQRIGVIVGTFLTSSMVEEAEKAMGSILIMLISVGFNELQKWAVKKVRDR